MTRAVETIPLKRLGNIKFLMWYLASFEQILVQMKQDTVPVAINFPLSFYKKQLKKTDRSLEKPLNRALPRINSSRNIFGIIRSQILWGITNQNSKKIGR